MGYRVALAAVMFVTAASFGNFDVSKVWGTYSGGGHWNMPDGQSGTFSSVTSVTKHAKGALVKEKLRIVHGDDTMEESSEWVAVFGKNGFFTMQVNGKNTGWGHCEGHTCQMEGAGHHAGSHFAETIVFTAGGAHRMGHEDGNGHVVTWKGAAKRK